MDCEHAWQPSESPLIRESFQAEQGWADYEYCPWCYAFREKP